VALPSADQAALVGVLERARSLGLVGPAELTGQIAHALAMAGAVEPAEHCVDLGSGAGIPALPVALAWPGSGWVLVESSERRAAFLAGAVEELGLADRVEVVATPAEQVGRAAGRGTADRVLARSFGPPAVTAECAAPLLRVGGLAVVSEPPGSTGQRWDALGETDLGLILASVTGGPGATFAVLEKVESTPERYPRQSARKRPLF
jgi:16S rRNA (guanine527-N7)-methyltransferase